MQKVKLFFKNGKSILAKPLLSEQIPETVQEKDRIIFISRDRLYKFSKKELGGCQYQASKIIKVYRESRCKKSKLSVNEMLALGNNFLKRKYWETDKSVKTFLEVIIR